MKTINNCASCAKAWKRSSFDFKKYGSYGFPFECTAEKTTTYRRPTDVCEKYEERMEK